MFIIHEEFYFSPNPRRIEFHRRCTIERCTSGVCSALCLGAKEVDKLHITFKNKTVTTAKLELKK